MKFVLPFIFVTLFFFSCSDVERVDVSNIKDELALSKPMVISDGELLSVAQQIGDSLTKDLTYNNDTSFTQGYNEVHIIGNTNKILEDVQIKTVFDAYQYTFDNDGIVKPNVANRKRNDIIQYYSAYLAEQKEMKMVLVNVSIKDINLKIAAERKK